ncbi:hypothetical protein PR048_015161 [Dryococelus australis]|uniref:Uncharacterized protein n=1 Tax=Dryococelus australis TaxID=614101 RepID=A0ABQ9HG66_9NEOP|nr:hypothetical protein PR048_015161 [Dryococelus australis]
MEGRGRWEILEKTRQPAASSGTIPTCENPRAAPPEIEPGSSWWKWPVEEYWGPSAAAMNKVESREITPDDRQEAKQGMT